MADYETKLKLGRKLKGADAATASDNQVSILFRHDGTGDKHVSITIESDGMKPDDVAALLRLLSERGLFTPVNSRTWVSQPQASEEKFGATTMWMNADVQQLAKQT
jgi:hypothetical protein